MDYFIILNICYDLNYKDRCLHKIIDNLKDSQHFKPNYISLGIDDDSSVCPFWLDLTCLFCVNDTFTMRGGEERCWSLAPNPSWVGWTWRRRGGWKPLSPLYLFSNFQSATRILVKANLHIRTYNYLEFCIATSNTFILPPKFRK